jgi:hypothetical protein
LLSFLLPGLGQLYEKRTIKAGFYFSLFVIGLSSFPLAVPFIAVFSGLEVLLMRMPVVEAEKRRRDIFLASGSVAFMGWFFSIASYFNPIAAQMQMNDKMERCAVEIRECRLRLGKYPLSLQECLLKEENWRDPWGNPVKYLSTGSGFELRSWGRDAIEGTKDDLTYSYH